MLYTVIGWLGQTKKTCSLDAITGQAEEHELADQPNRHFPGTRQTYVRAVYLFNSRSPARPPARPSPIPHPPSPIPQLFLFPRLPLLAYSPGGPVTYPPRFPVT
jgi:hypothetical protein